MRVSNTIAGFCLRASLQVRIAAPNLYLVEQGGKAVSRLAERRSVRICLWVSGCLAIVAAWIAFSWPANILPLVIFIAGSKAVESLQGAAGGGFPPAWPD